jgi:hypothetical protein
MRAPFRHSHSLEHEHESGKQRTVHVDVVFFVLVHYVPRGLET